MFSDNKENVTRCLISLCKSTKTPECKFEDFNEQKSKTILKYLDKFKKMCYHDIDKCKFNHRRKDKLRKGCELIGICIFENG